MFKRWHRDETNQRTDLKLNRTNQPLGHIGFFFWLQRIIEADISEPVGIQYSILSRAAVTWPRCSASAIPRGNQPLCGVLLPRSSGSRTDGIPKGSDAWGRLEPPSPGDRCPELPVYASGVRIRGADGRSSRGLLCSTRLGRDRERGDEDWRPASAGSACQGSAEICASFSGGCGVLLGRGELSASFSGSTMASFLGICMLLVCAAAVLNRWPGLHCISKYICGVRLLNSKSSERT
jgi:hypothetical protein